MVVMQIVCPVCPTTPNHQLHENQRAHYFCTTSTLHPKKQTWRELSFGHIYIIQVCAYIHMYIIPMYAKHQMILD